MNTPFDNDYTWGITWPEEFYSTPNQSLDTQIIYNNYKYGNLGGENLILIDSNTPDKDFIIQNLLPNTTYLFIDTIIQSYSQIISNIQNLQLNSVKNIGIIRENNNNFFNLPIEEIKNIDDNFKDFYNFIDFLLSLKTKFGMEYFDLITCNCYDIHWQTIIQKFRNEYNIHIRASVNITGAGGDWILESDNIDLVNIYFNENIVNYSHALLTSNFSLYLDSSRQMWGTGSNSSGNLSQGNTTNLNRFNRITNSTGKIINKIISGELNTMVVMTDGTLYSCGTGTNGQMGMGNTNNLSTLTLVQTLPVDQYVNNLSCGPYHSVLIMTDGSLYSSGLNTSGQLGLVSSISQFNTYTRVTSLPSNKIAKSVHCGESYTIVLMSDGTIYGCGNNTWGQLGDGSNNSVNRSLFQLYLPDNKIVSDLDCGYNHTVVLANDGTVYSCGRNTSGQLGLDNSNNYNTFQLMPLPQGTTATKVLCGQNHTIVMLSDGSVCCCGSNSDGQLGIGNNLDQLKLTLMNLPSGTVKSISPGFAHTYVLMTNGTMYATGRNTTGQLGNGNNTNSDVFVEMTKNESGVSSNITDAIALASEHFAELVPKVQNPQTLSEINMALWLKNDPNTMVIDSSFGISLWYDQSGKGNNAIQNTPSKTPKLDTSLGSVYFDISNGITSSEFDINLNFLIGTTHRAYFIIKSVTYPRGLSNFYGAKTGSQGGSSLRVGFNNKGTDTEYSFHVWNDYTNINANTNTNLFLKGFNLFSYNWLKDIKNVYTNNILEGTVFNSGKLIGIAGGGIIGGNVTGSGRYWNGYISEIIFLTGEDITPNNNQLITNYLMSKYNLYKPEIMSSDIMSNYNPLTNSNSYILKINVKNLTEDTSLNLNNTNTPYTINSSNQIQCILAENPISPINLRILNNNGSSEPHSVSSKLKTEVSLNTVIDSSAEVLFKSKMFTGTSLTIDTETSPFTYRNGQYNIKASSRYQEWNNPYAYNPYLAFLKNTSSVSARWNVWAGNEPYSTITGDYLGTINTSNIAGSNDISGEWIQIELPYRILLKTVEIMPVQQNLQGPFAYHLAKAPRSFVIVGSNDGINWNIIYSQTSMQTEYPNLKLYKAEINFTSNSSEPYSYIRLITRKVAPTVGINNGGAVAIQQLNYFGSIYQPLPYITSLNKYYLSTTGGESIKINGSSLFNTKNVNINNVNLGFENNISSNNSIIEFISPQNTSGIYQLNINNNESISNNKLLEYNDSNNIIITNTDVIYRQNMFPIETENISILSNETPIFRNGTYIVKTSGTIFDSPSLNGYNAFNLSTSLNGNYGYWHGTDSYSSTGYIGSSRTTISNGTIIFGEWIEISLPYKIVVKNISLTPRQDAFPSYIDRMPLSMVIVGSNDGLNWFNIYSQTQLPVPYSTTPFTSTTIPISTISKPYSYLRLITRTTVSSSTLAVNILSINYNGDIYPLTYTPLEIIGIDISSNLTIGGSTITLTGSGFTNNSILKIDNKEIPFTLLSETQLSFITPPNPSGLVQINITRENEVSNSVSFQYYNPNVSNPINFYKQNYGATIQTLKKIFTKSEFLQEGYTSFYYNLEQDLPLSPICFFENTPIVTDQGEIMIQNIIPGKHTIRNNEIIAITKTITFEKNLILIRKDSLGNNYPSKDTIITKNHKIILNDNLRVKAKTLFEKFKNKGIELIKYNEEILYNVLLKKHDKMIVNNLIVETLDPNNIIAKLYFLPEEIKEEIIIKLNKTIINNNIREYIKIYNQLK
jgi:alpha-tubulin suppressor-like RCC1 family protein